MIVAGYSRRTLGFLVQEADHIICVEQDKIHPVEGMLLGNKVMVTATAELPDGKLVSLLDTEQIIASAFGEDAAGNAGKMERGHELCS